MKTVDGELFFSVCELLLCSEAWLRCNLLRRKRAREERMRKGRRLGISINGCRGEKEGEVREEYRKQGAQHTVVGTKNM